jgi:hypothetical protein
MKTKKKKKVKYAKVTFVDFDDKERIINLYGVGDTCTVIVPFSFQVGDVYLKKNATVTVEMV